MWNYEIGTTLVPFISNVLYNDWEITWKTWVYMGR